MTKTDARLKISREVRKMLNSELYFLGLTYHDSIPMAAITGLLEGCGLFIEECLLCGESGRGSFEIRGKDGDLCDDCLLIMTWYRMPSGRYEITAYLS